MHAGRYDVDQCSCGRSGCAHNHIPLLFPAEIANWLPEVSIPTHLLAVHFEYLVVRSNVTINKLVSQHSMDSL
jgi:hypothetical protein